MHLAVKPTVQQAKHDMRACVLLFANEVLLLRIYPPAYGDAVATAHINHPLTALEFLSAPCAVEG